MRQVAKLFANGGSQAVRLPDEFHFEGAEDYIRRDPETGDVIPSKKPRTSDRLLAALANKDDSVDFLSAQERWQPASNSDPFEGWQE